MAKNLLYILVLFACCRAPQPVNNKPPVLTAEDSLKLAKLKDDSLVQKNLAARSKFLGEKNLRLDTTIKNEFRLYFFQPRFRGMFLFFKISYADSTLTTKQFTLVDPAGMGVDSVYSVSCVRLSAADFNTLAILIDKAMFWNLETTADNGMLLDANSYIYEARRVQGYHRLDKISKKYHVVVRQAPHNFDFINLGEFFKYKAKLPNRYKS